MERGEWVLLDNVNLCNPTVLDRLNPLLEPGLATTIIDNGFSTEIFLYCRTEMFQYWLTQMFWY
eukprot:299750-Rhodomonas_salina.2